MRAAWMVLLCFGLSAPIAAGRQAAPYGHVVEAEEIRAAGAMRIGEILELVPTLTPVSDDGFQTEGSLFGAGPGRWRVAVNGQEIDLSMLGTLHAELIPVSVTEITRVVVHPPGPGPGSVGYSPTGWVMIETRDPTDWRFAAAASAGNPAGDPGPFRYTPGGSPNVDRAGPTASIGAQTATGPWHAALHLRADQSHLTHPAVDDRVYNLYEGRRKPRSTLIAPSATVGYEAGRLRQSVSFDTAQLRDLVLWEAMGSEMPATAFLRTWRGAGTLALPRSRTLRWAVSRQRLWYEERENRHELELSWEEMRADGRVILANASGWHVGLGASRRAYETDRVGTGHLFAGHRIGRPGGWVRDFGFGLARSSAGSAVRPSGHLSLEKAAGGRTLAVRGALFWSLPHENGEELVYLLRDFDYPGRGRGRTVLPEDAADTRSFALDAVLAVPVEDGSAGVASWFRQYHGLNLPIVLLEPDSLFRPRYFGNRDYTESASGSTTGIRAWVEQQFGPNLGHRLDYSIALDPRGTDAFVSRAGTEPATRIRHRLRLSPVPRMHLYLTTRFRSSTTWDFVLREPGEPESVRIPASIRLDATLTKELWGPRMRVQAGIRNLLRSTRRTHPLGPPEDLTLTVGLWASL